MIHLVNGNSTLGTLKQSALAGDMFSADDILMEGPTIDGLHSESSWETRAEYLERCFAIPAAEYLAAKSERERILRQALTRDEIVLWFGPDVFCQMNLLYLLDWFAATDLRRTRLTLICPATFAACDRFRCLGELDSQQLESLFSGRAEMTAGHLRSGQMAWQAFAADNPQAIEDFLAADFTLLPLVAPALRAHLGRFPSMENGLGILQQTTLQVLAEQPLDFATLFSRVTATPEIFHHGMGDLQLKAYLAMWTSELTPLIHGHDLFAITAGGRRVLDGKDDGVRLNGIDLWYGGVHLSAENQWRWDSSRERITRVGPG